MDQSARCYGLRNQKHIKIYPIRIFGYWPCIITSHMYVHYTTYVCALHLGCAVQFSIPRGYHWVHRGCSVQWGDTMTTPEDIMRTLGGISWLHWGCSVHWGFNTNSIVFPMTFPPHLSWYPPGILMISHRCTEHPPVYYTPSPPPPPLYCTDIMQGFLCTGIKILQRAGLNSNAPMIIRECSTGKSGRDA